MLGTIDIEVYEKGEAQAIFLVHGYDDVFWTDDLTEAVQVFTQALRTLSKKPREYMGGFCADCGEHCDYC